MPGPTHSARIEFAFPSDLPGIRVLRIEASTHLWHVLNDIYTVSTPLSSAAEFRYRGRSHALSDQSVLLLDPDEVFEVTRMPFPERCRVLHISPDVMEDAARELGIRGGRVRFKQVLVHGRALFRVTTRLHEALESHHSALERQALFVHCVQQLLEETTEVKARRPMASPEPAAVRRTRELLDARFSENVSLDELARASGISRFHLSRTFGSAVGLPPHAYQNQLRVNLAAKLLSAGMSAADVAADVGFADQSHLHRHFKRIIGVTPGEFVRGEPSRHQRGARTLRLPA